MNKAEFIKAVANNTGSSQSDAARFINAFIDEISIALENGESIQFVGFGSFCVNTRAARVGRNPRTGQSISIPEYKYVCFKQGKLLKTRVNDK